MLEIIKRLSQIDIKPGELEISKATVTDSTISSGLEILFGAIGVVAMITIVISGMMFSLSRGNPEKAAKARRGVIYSAIGLGISLLAFVIVRFVVRRVV